MLQGLLEGVAYEMRLNLHLLGQAGLAVDSLRATGGGARDPRLCQLKADAIDRPLALLAEPEAGCLGMAAAGWAAVHGADPAATAAAWARTTAVIEPRAAHRQAHAERFAAYRALYGALAGLAAPRAVAGSAQP
jgi:xylulokinase